MDQQQLQIARAALWRQTVATRPSAPLRTFDDAAAWLDDIGLCLYLPRHTQLPAPAPSFVEACLGAPSLTPPAAALAQAAELAARLIGERRAIPLNLLGAYSEQPDFLIAPEVLPWVAAVRGDRQWKAAPAGRTAPIVTRTFQALDREGELTAYDLSGLLGHEISESAALRALIELWTTLRAMPVYAPERPTRWTLLKTRYPAQLGTGANTSQTTALSALISIYLRSAVAATAEEAEIFLSPLTARSRIREVIHGMMATRQLGTTTVASHTLLFIEGSLPEAAPPAEPQPQPAPLRASPPAPLRNGPPAPIRKDFRTQRWQRPAQSGPARANENRAGWKKPPATAGAQSGAYRGPREGKRFPGPRPDSAPDSAPRPGARPAPRSGRPGGKPWQRRRPGEFPARDFPRKNRQASSEDRPPRPLRPSGPARPGRPFRPDRPPRPDRSAQESRFRPGQRPSRETSRAGNDGDRARFRDNRKSGNRNTSAPRPPSRPPAGRRPGNRFSSPRREPSGASADRRPSGRFGKPSGPSRPGKFSARKPGPPAGRPTRTARPFPPKNKFRKPTPRKPNPRKNRSQEENPE